MKQPNVCLRCGKAKVARYRITCDPCLEVELILKRDPKLPQRVRKSLDDVKSGIYWTLKKKGKTMWFIPSLKLQKRGAKPHKL